MPDCPYCGEWFRSKKGLKQHITKTHTSVDIFGERFIDPLKIDPLRAIEKRAEREKKRKRHW